MNKRQAKKHALKITVHIDVLADRALESLQKVDSQEGFIELCSSIAKIVDYAYFKIEQHDQWCQKYCFKWSQKT